MMCLLCIALVPDHAMAGWSACCCLNCSTSQEVGLSAVTGGSCTLSTFDVAHHQPENVPIAYAMHLNVQVGGGV
jgi:hypothetical protein